MKLEKLLSQLDKHDIAIGFDHTEEDGTRTIILGCALPSFPYGGGRFVYYTLTLSPGQTEVSQEEREAIKRHLYHLTTDIFEDDGDVAELRAAGLSEEIPGPNDPPLPYRAPEE